MNVELINPKQIVRCVIGDRLTPSGWWKTEYACTRRTPWFLRIFGVNKDKYEWVIYQGIYKEPYRQHWLFNNYYSSRDEFNKKYEDYYCECDADGKWVVSRKAFVKLFFSDGTTIVRRFHNDKDRDAWLLVNEVSNVIKKDLIDING